MLGKSSHCLGLFINKVIMLIHNTGHLLKTEHYRNKFCLFRFRFVLPHLYPTSFVEMLGNLHTIKLKPIQMWVFLPAKYLAQKTVMNYSLSLQNEQHRTYNLKFQGGRLDVRKILTMDFFSYQADFSVFLDIRKMCIILPCF